MDHNNLMAVIGGFFVYVALRFGIGSPVQDAIIAQLLWMILVYMGVIYRRIDACLMEKRNG